MDNTNRRDDIARAAARDAANRQMRAEGRTEWSREDYTLAATEYNRLIDFSPLFTLGGRRTKHAIGGR